MEQIKDVFTNMEKNVNNVKFVVLLEDYIKHVYTIIGFNTRCHDMYTDMIGIRASTFFFSVEK